MRKMTFLDLFAGVGGFRLALELASFKCVGYVEWDKFARKTYELNFDTNGEWTAYDITKIPDSEIQTLGQKTKIDIICGGFPCQAFSVAGKRCGFDDTRGTLFFEICRFVKLLKPQVILLENVKGLLSHDNGRTFFTILNTLAQLGYDVEWQVLNSKDFEVPQNRERVILIGYPRGQCRGQVFPLREETEGFINQIANISKRKNSGFKNPQDGRIFGVDGIAPTLTSNGADKSPKIFYCAYDKYSKRLCVKKDNIIQEKEIANCIDANYAKGLDAHQARTGVMVRPVFAPAVLNKSQNGRRVKGMGEPMFTLTGCDQHGILIKKATLQGWRIRKLTPLECFRLQAFPDRHCLIAKQNGVSDSQLYKQAGNTVTVSKVYTVARAIAKFYRHPVPCAAAKEIKNQKVNSFV